MKNKFEVTFGDTRKIGELIYSLKIFSNYEIVICDDFYYIAADGKAEDILSTIDRNVFLAAVELGDILAKEGCFSFFANKKFNVDIPPISSWPDEVQEHIKNECKYFYDKINSHILNWCLKYGVPFFEDGVLDLLDDETFFLNTGRYGFIVNSFISQLIRFHANFYRWRYAEFDEEPEWFNEKKRPLEMMANSLSSTFIGDISYQLRYDKKANHFGFDWCSHNLFNLLNLQLALLATRNDPDGKHIKRCVKCNDWFEADHGAQIYCEKRRGCNAKAVAQANWRKTNRINKHSNRL